MISMTAWLSVKLRNAREAKIVLISWLLVQLENTLADAVLVVYVILFTAMFLFSCLRRVFRQ